MGEKKKRERKKKKKREKKRERGRKRENLIDQLQTFVSLSSFLPEVLRSVVRPFPARSFLTCVVCVRKRERAIYIEREKEMKKDRERRRETSACQPRHL